MVIQEVGLVRVPWRAYHGKVCWRMSSGGFHLESVPEWCPLEGVTTGIPSRVPRLGPLNGVPWRGSDEEASLTGVQWRVFTAGDGMEGVDWRAFAVGYTTEG
jgi:hypothetical protein